MSAPRRRSRHKRQLSRRDFLKRSAQATAALSLAPLLAACARSASPSRTSNGNGNIFLHGVASGDPLSDRVILWTRVTDNTTASIPVNVVVATDTAFTQNVHRAAAVASAARDFTVKIDMTGLQAGTTYYYQFHALGQSSAIGRTRTLPTGSVDHLRIGVLSCSSYAHGFFNAYARIAERADLDLVLHLGDYIYEYGNGEYGSARTYEPAHEIVTLDDYRTRHAYYKQEPDVQAMHQQHAIVATWDDHESANDSWKDGAENHQTIEGVWSTRKSLAQQAYDEWMPIRSADPSRIYRGFSFGNLVQLLMLDTRLLARAEQIAATIVVPDTPVGVFTASGSFIDPSRELLGAEQETWMLSQLRNSTATWQLLGQQVMFGQLKVLGLPNATGLSQFLNPDQWDGYPVARSRIHTALRGDGSNPAINNAVVLTGDIHTSWAMDITEDPNNLLAYNPLSGEGSIAVEFVTTSVTSPGLEALAAVQDVIRTQNPHIKYVDLALRGYTLLDITPARCLCEYWSVDTIAARSSGQTFETAFQTLAGANRLSAATQTTPRPAPPALAPTP